MKANHPQSDILFLESRINYTLVYYKNGKTELLSYTLKKVEAQLASTKSTFLRIHRSFLVNQEHIKRCNDTNVQLSNGIILPVARRRKQYLN
ncbi:LytTR family DNA-binding domain-containing protein [Emticicia sp. W12TSBA100-4]|uniref:LytR/AlgR family response regulator transcription factor n=1 Tax=Emticicia sp. W12TSBA100-4 TaxID=3160965 RepID=UPI003305E305